MTTEHERPIWRCHARQSDGASIASAPFVLVADDCERGPDGRHTKTEIFGFFILGITSEFVDDDDTIVTASLEVPIGSPIALLAHKVAASSRRARKAGAMLRRNIVGCPCPPDRDYPPDGDCPALSDLHLLQALEHASYRRPPRRRPDRG